MVRADELDLDEEIDEVRPSVAKRADGVALLYPSRVNTIFGRSESGKSWFTLACALSVIADGGHVLVVDCEDSKAGLIHRLRSLGVPTELRRRIAYRR